jgi:hypothetical protein
LFFGNLHSPFVVVLAISDSGCFGQTNRISLLLIYLPVFSNRRDTAMKKMMQDLMVAGMGAFTSILTAFILLYAEEYSGFSFYTWSFWFIIPAGAILSGCVAASGYYFGARLFNVRPTYILLLNVVGISIGTFFLIHRLSYEFMEIKGVPISDIIPFWTYLSVVIEHTSLTFSWRATQLGSTGEMGGLGYIHAVIQIIGFALGGLFIYIHLQSIPYCGACSRFLKMKGKQVRYSMDANGFKDLLILMNIAFQAGSIQDAVNKHAQSENAPKDGHLRSDLELWKCMGCGVNIVQYKCHKKTGQDRWEELSDFN